MECTVFFLCDVLDVLRDEVEVGGPYFYVSGFGDSDYYLEVVVVIVFGLVEDLLEGEVGTFPDENLEDFEDAHLFNILCIAIL